MGSAGSAQAKMPSSRLQQTGADRRDATPTAATPMAGSESQGNILAELNKVAEASKSETGGLSCVKTANGQSSLVPLLQQQVQQHAAVSTEIAAVVDKCWNDVDVRCSRAHPFVGRPADAVRSSNWTTVTVFVSSTFRDFYYEREMLVKKVFPELREWCENKKIEIVDCDLRWGVPKDTNSVDTILTCLHEIERCHQETGGEPFFIGMVGDRFGWVPTEEELTAQLQDEYEWVINSSVTFMEFLLGAIWPRSRNAVFFIRDSNYVSQLPDSYKASYVESSDLLNHQLKVLKEQLHHRFSPCHIVSYSVTVEASDSGNKVALTGLEHFAAAAVSFMKTAIEKKYRESNSRSHLDSDQLDDELQSIYIHKLVERGDFNREAELTILSKYSRLGLEGLSSEDAKLLKHGPDEEFMSSSEFEEWSTKCGVDSTWTPHLLVTASNYGYLPEALLAQLATTLQASELNDVAPVKVFTYFEPSVPTWTDVTMLLRRLSTFLDCKVIDDGWVGNQTTYKEVMIRLIDHLKKTMDRVTLIFSLNETGKFMSNWFPPAMPRGCQCVVTSTQLLENTARAWLGFGCYELQLAPLHPTAIESYVSRFFRKYNKRLDAEQVNLLLSNTGSCMPMWLAVACEDLRMFGEFRLVTKKISSFPPDLDKLLGQILEQLVREDETACLEKALCILFCCGLVGVRQADMLRLLQSTTNSKHQNGSQHEGVAEQLSKNFDEEQASQEPVSRLVWSKIYRNLKSYLHTWYSYEHHRSYETYKLSTPVLAEVVRSSFLSDACRLRELRLEIADYYASEHVSNMSMHSFDAAVVQYSEVAAKSSLLRLCRISKLTDYMPRRNCLQSMRCWSQAGQASPSVNHHVRLCTTCSFKSGAFSGLPIRNSDSCIICGAFVFGYHPSASSYAALCIHHSISRHPNTCFLCPMPLPQAGGAAHTAVKMKLCHMCSVSKPPGTCCHLVT